jgi:porphobilinogen synthase
MARETRLTPDDLVLPLFVCEGEGVADPIASMPGHARLSIDRLLDQAKTAVDLGLPGLALFPAIPEELKDPAGSASTDPNGLLPRAIRALKSAHPELVVITDTALDPYSSDGHDGLVRDGEILNDDTLPLLAAMAVAQAEAGADVIAPSDMMDGRVAAIREALDEAGHTNVAIGSYCAKYASAFYGPFREAADSAPQFGDRRGYQMDPPNVREALREVRLDVEEGADMVMVKPALPYLDVIRAVAETFDRPVAAYNVSGEYAMVKAAAEKGWIDEDRVMRETLTSIRRAGADIILTYHAKDFARGAR